MAVLYNVSLDELIDFDMDIREIREAIDKTSEKAEQKIDWTSAWGKNTLFFSNTGQLLIFRIMLTD